MAKKQGKPIEFRLVRRNKETGKLEGRKRGRLPPLVENGYTIGNDETTFKAGDPPKKRGRRRRAGRPKGSNGRASVVANGKRGPGRPSLNRNGLSDIEKIVANEVRNRLKSAKAAALKAFTGALGV